MKNAKLRNICISVFVAAWLCVFFYESTRYFFLEPLARTVFHVKKLPIFKFLFPPAGWIMFFNVSPEEGEVVVYGIKNGQPYRLDPHEIYPVRFIGFDNIHRGIMGQVLDRRMRRPFCRYLKRKIPYFERFAVTYVYYPSVVKNRYQRREKVIYQCR